MKRSIYPDFGMPDEQVMRHSQQDIEHALQSVARVIERYGDSYWPIFDRLENELECRAGRAARLAKYRSSSL